MVPHTVRRRQPSHQRRKTQRSRRRRKSGSSAISNEKVPTPSPAIPSKKHVKSTGKTSVDKNLERVDVKATMNVTFNIKAWKTRTDNDRTEQAQNKEKQNAKGNPAEACRCIQPQQVVARKERWVLRNRRIFSSPGARISKRGCGKKRTGRFGSSPDRVMDKIRRIYQINECGYSKGSETEYAKEGDVANCKSESDGTDVRSLSKGNKPSRSSSISEIDMQYLYDNEEDGDARSEDDGEDPRILELEDAITRTAERCALLQEKIDATNRANRILRDSARADGFI